MRILISKFGATLISRSAGKEAYLAFRPILKGIKEGENIEIDFGGISTIGPSWADEFLTPIFEKYKGRVKITNAENSSVKAVLEFLEEIRRK